MNSPVTASIASSPSSRQGMDREQAWADLSAACAEPNPFHHPAFLVPAMRHLPEGQSVRVIEARGADGVLIGLLPLVVRTRHSRYRIRNCANWMHDHCFFGAPLLRTGREEEAWAGILATLDAADWAGDFLHLAGIDLDGVVVTALRDRCRREGRALAPISAHERALLHGETEPDAWLQKDIRAKKRKEMRRLTVRLEECGAVLRRRLDAHDDVEGWAHDFLALERAGWKGAQGTALDCSHASRAFFLEMTARASAAGMLDMQRIDVDGAAIAMLVTLRMGVGAFSYKIAFDERFARYSPGVLLELDATRSALTDSGLAWVDSCAAPDHPMINSLWTGRRRIGQFRVALKGRGAQALRRRLSYAGVGMAERARRAIRGRVS